MFEVFRRDPSFIWVVVVVFSTAIFLLSPLVLCYLVELGHNNEEALEKNKFLKSILETTLLIVYYSNYISIGIALAVCFLSAIFK